MRLFCFGLVMFTAALSTSLNGQTPGNGHLLTPAWVQRGEGNQRIARIVVDTPRDCPAIKLDGADQPMALRMPLPEGLKPVCEFMIPYGAKSASVNGQVLSLANKNPQRVIVLGDTGCRIKGTYIQDCNDPSKWPFAQVAANAAAEHPDLIVDVGDYLYRESPCPAQQQAMCGGTPAGDNWDAWNADFFTPARSLLMAAPWAFSRGNHEECDRSWRGWFYYLDPRPWNGTCQIYSLPYVVNLGKMNLIVFDSSEVSEDQAKEEQVNQYASQLAGIAKTKNAWLVAHHPFWAMKAGASAETPIPISVPLQEAWKRSPPQGIRLILSGHVHLFEMLSFDHRRPPQLVAGDGGTDMAPPIRANVNGTMVYGATVVASESQRQFGYTLLTRITNASKKSVRERHGKGKFTWELSLKNRSHEVLVDCALSDRSAQCQAKP